MGYPLEIQVNGETVWKSGEGERVNRVGLTSARGEAGSIGIDRDTRVVNLQVDVEQGVVPVLTDRDNVVRSSELRSDVLEPVAAEATAEDFTPDTEEEDAAKHAEESEGAVNPLDLSNPNENVGATPPEEEEENHKGNIL